MTIEGERQHNTHGMHLVGEYSGCGCRILNDEVAIESLLVQAAKLIVGRIFHRFRPQGVTGCLMLAESHLAIHTWPEAGSASVDLFTSRICDPDSVHTILEESLGAKDSQIVVVDRGLPSPEKGCVRGHWRVASYTLDCRGPQLPDDVCVGQSPGRGFGLFASRDFVSGDLVYEAPAILAE